MSVRWGRTGREGMRAERRMGLRGCEPSAGLDVGKGGGPRGKKRRRPWAGENWVDRVGCWVGWAGFGFSIFLVFFVFSISFLFQTYSNKFEFKPYAVNQIKLMHQHECTNMLN